MARLRVLVVYGSARGGTAGLARLVADTLAGYDVDVDVHPAADVTGLGDYDAVVVGGALYGNRWHSDAVDFVRRHRGRLQTMPVWFFSSGPLDDSARSGALAPVPQVRDLGRDLDIRGHMTFGGVLASRPTGLIASLLSWGPEGDWRDPAQVAEWVERIAAGLEQAPTRVIWLDAEITLPPPEQPVADAGRTRLWTGERTSASAVAAEDGQIVRVVTDGRDHDYDDRGPDGHGLAKIRRLLTADDDESEDVGLDVLL